jgi:V8-like Glu-specific endopeptidase
MFPSPPGIPAFPPVLAALATVSRLDFVRIVQRRNIMNALSRFAVLLAFAAAAALPAQASESEGAQQRLKAALNDMVQEVRQAETAPAKRAMIERFIVGMERNAQATELLPFLGEEKRAALNALREKFNGYQAELQGLDGRERVADADLNGFAGFMQQDLEQAATSGGIYLSTGAVIIILLILILIL